MNSLDGLWEVYNGKYEKIFINCPVDVIVIDSNGNSVAQIIDEKIVDDEDSLYAYIDDNGQKVIVIPSDDNYNVKIEAREDCEVTYSIKEYTMEDNIPERIISYESIPVQKGKTITASIAPEDSNYTLFDSDNNSLKSSIDLSEDNVQTYTVSVETTGKGSVLGGGLFTSGEFAKVTAVPEEGEKFLGWYDGISLVSELEEYRFCVKNDVTLTGKFTDTKGQETGDEGTAGISTEDTPGSEISTQIKTDLKVSEITLFAISKQIAAGKSLNLTASVLPKNATNKKLKWTSSNTKVATVSQAGKVKVKKGTGGKSVTITAKATDGSGKKAVFKIKVMKGAVKSIKIKGAKKTLKVGKKMKLKATVKVTKGKPVNKKLKWTSSNKKYATVTSKGVVKALKAGKGNKVTITAMATDGTGKKKKISFKIK